MILRMDQNPTFFETDDEPLSIWPWVVGAIALLGAVFLTVQSSQSIEASIGEDVRQAIAAQQISGIDVDVNGRDVNLTGTVDISVDKGQVISTIGSLKGVRVVSDNLSVFDPLAAAAERTQLFESQFSRLNFSALAFEQGSASLTQASRPALDALTQLLLQYPEQRIRVSGHTDNTGRPAVNLRISRERATTVASYITSRGVNNAQVVARGFGASNPIADNATENGRARNRRIEISHLK